MNLKDIVNVKLTPSFPAIPTPTGRMILICPQYSVFMQVCSMYGVDPRNMILANTPETLYGIDPKTPAYIYSSAGMTRGMRECVDFLKHRGMPITELREKYMGSQSMYQ